MANDTATQPSPVVTLFQKAHGRMVMLQRLDEQLQGLIDQRQKLQEELRAVQSQINEEFDRVMRQAEEAPAKLLGQIAEQGHNGAPANGRMAIEATV